MSTLKSLKPRLDKVDKKIQKEVSEASKVAALGIVKYLAFATPVDTSQALSNWQVGIDTRVNTEIDAHFLGGTVMRQPKGSTQSQSANRTIALAKAEIKNKKPGQTINITNNLDYIQELEEGKSPKNSYFVERSLIVGENIIEKELATKLRNL